VDGRSLDSTTQDIIDRQISHYLDHDLPVLGMPSYAQRDEGGVPLLTMFIKQKKTDFVLWGLRSVIISLQYDDNHAEHLSQLACSTLTKMTFFTQEARQSFSLRHRMTSALSNALLVFCSLLVRHFAGSTHPHTEAHIEAFHRAKGMLHDLAYSQPYAKRVLSDFESIMRVVEDCLDGKDAPDNVAELFPYQSSSADIRGVLWL